VEDFWNAISSVHQERHTDAHKQQPSRQLTPNHFQPQTEAIELLGDVRDGGALTLCSHQEGEGERERKREKEREIERK
jgi:hypothetical protein